MTITNLQFKWERGSLNDTAIKVLKSNNIDWHYDICFNLVADFYGIGLYQKVNYERLHDNVYEIFGGGVER